MSWLVLGLVLIVWGYGLARENPVILYSLADVLLFGGFLAWAVADRISLKRRAQAGPLPTTAVLPASAANDLIAVVGGLALYGLTVGWAHAALFGVRPFGG